MSDFNQGVPGSQPAIVDMGVDAGLRSFMLGVYNKMALGLIVSAGMAYLTGTYEPVRVLMFVADDNGRIGFSLLGWVVALAPLAIIIFGMRGNVSPRRASISYWAIVALLGASLGTLVLRYTGASIFSTFLITATSFGVLSLVGYTTKKNLSGFGSFLIMGLWGLIAAIVLNMFFPMPGLGLIISIIGVFIFAGLIAADTQKLKVIYYHVGGDQAAMSVATSYGALNLYLDFINLFQFLLSLFGGRR
jgi:FtsH-binding integral membrane protein